MEKMVISVLGQDRPGIIAAVSKILLEQDCNIENVSQTILQSEFSGIFIVAAPPDKSIQNLEKILNEQLQEMQLHVYVKPMAPVEPAPEFNDAEPFVITTRGPDRKGLVAGITEVIARHGVNVTNLQAVFKGGDDPDKNIMIYEVDIPKYVDQAVFSQELRQRAEQLGLMVSIQHRRIFEAINRI